MSVSEEYREFVVSQLGPIVPLRVRRMFGGIGLYAHELFFAVIDNDALFFKVDDENRAEYLAAGMGPFAPMGDDKPMSYYQVPTEVLDDRDELRGWVERAVAVAERAAARKRKKKA